MVYSHIEILNVISFNHLLFKNKGVEQMELF